MLSLTKRIPNLSIFENPSNLKADETTFHGVIDVLLHSFVFPERNAARLYRSEGFNF